MREPAYKVLDDQPPRSWKINRTTNKLEGDAVLIETPEGFIFRLFNDECLKTLVKLADPEDSYIPLSDSSILRKDGDSLFLVSSDPWINKEAQYSDKVCSIKTLANILANYLEALWLMR